VEKIVVVGKKSCKDLQNKKLISSSFHKTRINSPNLIEAQNLVPPVFAHFWSQSDSEHCSLDGPQSVDAYLYEIENGFFVIGNGLDGVIIDSDGYFFEETACFCNSDLLEIGSACLHLTPKLQELDNIFVGMDAAWHNYYHFMWHSLARCYMAARFLPASYKMILPDYASRVGSASLGYRGDTYNQALFLSGLSSRVTGLTPGLYRAKHLRFIWTEPRHPDAFLCLPDMYEMFAHIRRSLRWDAEASRRLLISREMASDPRLGGDAAAIVHNVCAEHGFTILRLEELNLYEQAQAFFNAECVIAPHGAGLINILFGQESLRVLELNKELDDGKALRDCFFRMASARHQSYWTVNISKNEINFENIGSAIHCLLQPSVEFPISCAPETEMSYMKNRSTADVHVGLEGWMFLQTGSNHVLDLFTRSDAYPLSLHRGWVTLLIERQQIFSRQNKKYLHLVAPDKLGIFSEYYGDDKKNFDNGPLVQLTGELKSSGEPSCLVDPTDVLRGNAGELPSYFKTDSHWTIWGAYLVYKLICDRLGVAIMAEFNAASITKYPALFDLGRKVIPNVYEDNIFVSPSDNIIRTFANSIVLRREEAERNKSEIPGHHGSRIILKNISPTASKEIIVLFGDSYSDYRPASLTYFLAEQFSEVHFVWSTDIDLNYVERIGATVIITEIAERFMTRLPQGEYIVED